MFVPFLFWFVRKKHGGVIYFSPGIEMFEINVIFGNRYIVFVVKILTNNVLRLSGMLKETRT